MRYLALAVAMYLNMTYHVYYERRNLQIEPTGVTPYILASVLVVVALLLLCCGYMFSRMVKRMSLKQRKLRKRKFYLSFLVLFIVILALTTLSIKNLMECLVILGLLTYWLLQVTIARLKHHHVVIRSIARGFDRIIGWIVFGPIMFISMFLPFLSSFQQRVMFNNAFTSGLEVSKLFAHDVAPSQVVKVKRVKKKGAKREE